MQGVLILAAARTAIGSLGRSLAGVSAPDPGAAVVKHLIDVDGGAIAFGHPVGASGARILVTPSHEMTHSDTSTGLAKLCIGGGEGVALAV